MTGTSVVLPGQLDLIAKVDIDRHQRKRSGLPVTQYAMRRAQGLLTLLPATMFPASVNEGADGSVEFTWERNDLDAKVVLRLCAMPEGGVRYFYRVDTQREKSQAGGHLKPLQSDPEAIMIVRQVVALLTPKELTRPSNVSGEQLQ